MGETNTARIVRDYPQLLAPTLTASGSVVTITDGNNGSFTTRFGVYVDGGYVGERTPANNTIDVSVIYPASGTYSVTARSVGDGFLSSDLSAAVDATF